ncbi:unnamed protein product [Rhodiola kirilowii]
MRGGRENHSKLMKIEELMEPQTPLAAPGAKLALSKEDSPEEKSVIPFQSGESEDCGNESFSGGIFDKDTEMAKVEMEKRMALIKAWEDNEKAKAENRAYKKMILVEYWEEKKKAALELKLKEIEENLEKAKAVLREQKKNKEAELRKVADEKRAVIEAQCGRNIVEIVGKADRYRATGRKLANGQYQILSAEQEIEFSREFRLHNKPAVKVIKTIYGEHYSCVDFYQQPAFDHPLLKNHSYNYDQLPYQNVSSESMLLESLWANGEGCPPGTVLIRKYTKSEFIRSKLFQQQISVSPMDDAYPPGNFDIQYAAGYLAVRARDDSFQVGWMIGVSQCFNTMCPGLVITSRAIALGSQRGSKKYDFKFTIVRNPANQQWQLQLGDNGQVIGFWPNEILKGLSGPADYVEWGGEGGISDVATEISSNDNNLYRVLDRGFVNNALGHVAAFGGPRPSSLSDCRSLSRTVDQGTEKASEAKFRAMFPWHYSKRPPQKFHGDKDDPIYEASLRRVPQGPNRLHN